MREIKIKYTVKRESGYIFSEIFTLAQIEKGEVNTWIKINYINENDICKNFFIDKKNNIEYYENDIVKVNNHYDGDTFIKEQLGIIKFIEYEFAIYNKDGGFICSFFDFIFNYNGGLLGNIYQNIELLGG